MRSTSLRIRVPALLATAGIFAASNLSTPLTAQTTTPVVVASGLNNPRGLAFGPNGLLYVVEAGRGGTSALCLPGIDSDPPRCYGPTGSVTQVAPNGQLRVITGLPSVAGPTGAEATGPHDIDFGFNNAWITIGLGTDPANRAQFEAAGVRLGRLMQITFTGQISNPLDISGFEAANNPDGGLPDSNPYGLRILSTRGVVADAGANALLQLGANGISTLAVFPTRIVPNPFGGNVPMQAVPTSVVEGPDGSLYVGELTGFPFPAGGARVYRVPANGGTPTVVATGFTNIIDVAIGPDGSAYVLEHDADGLLAPGTVGRLTKIGLFGSRTEIAPGLLNVPGGITFGPDRAVYVTTNSTSAGGGQVVRIANP